MTPEAVALSRKYCERQFQLAMAHEPVSPLVRSWYAYFFLQLIGRPEEAVAEMELALKTDPLNILWRECLGECLMAAGRFGEALKVFGTVLELDKNYFIAYFMLAVIHAVEGSLDEAVTYAERAHSLVLFPDTAGILAGLLHRTGNIARAKSLMHEIGDGKAYGSAIGFAWYHLICLEIEKAAHWVEGAIESRHPELIFLNLYLKLFHKPGWPALAKRLNLQ